MVDLHSIFFIYNDFWLKLAKQIFLTTPTFDLDLLSDDLDLDIGCWAAGGLGDPRPVS